MFVAPFLCLLSVLEEFFGSSRPVLKDGNVTTKDEPGKIKNR
jgi:hypothetical protein